jgi:hypothetical protein
MKKPNELSIRKTAATVGRLNNSLPPFPEGDETDEIREWAISESWRAKLDLDGFVASQHSKEPQEGFNQRSYQGKRPDSQEEPRSQAQKRNTQEWRCRKTLKPNPLHGQLLHAEESCE